MLYLNQATFAGRVGKIATGNNHAFISLAIKRFFIDEDGNKQVGGDWIGITVLSDPLVSFTKNHLSKGTTIYVTAHVENNKFEKDGKTVYEMRIIANAIQFVDPSSPPPLEAPNSSGADVESTTAVTKH